MLFKQNGGRHVRNSRSVTAYSRQCCVNCLSMHPFLWSIFVSESITILFSLLFFLLIWLWYRIFQNFPWFLLWDFFWSLTKSSQNDLIKPFTLYICSLEFFSAVFFYYFYEFYWLFYVGEEISSKFFIILCSFWGVLLFSLLYCMQNQGDFSNLP